MRLFFGFSIFLNWNSLNHNKEAHWSFSLLYEPQLPIAVQFLFGWQSQTTVFHLKFLLMGWGGGRHNKLCMSPGYSNITGKFCLWFISGKILILGSTRSFLRMCFRFSKFLCSNASDLKVRKRQIFKLKSCCL